MLPFPEIEKIAEPPPPPVEHAATWWWWAGAIVVGIILLSLLAWGVAVLVRRASVPAAPVRPEKQALRELKHLRKTGAALGPFEFGTALSEIVRSFLHRRAGMLARYATTDEILGKSRRRDQAPPPPWVGTFTDVLEDCDAVKFGAGRTGAREELIAKTESAINSVNKALKHHEAPALTPPAPPLPDLPHAPAS
jgi:hypothetical protein